MPARPALAETPASPRTTPRCSPRSAGPASSTSGAWHVERRSHRRGDLTPGTALAGPAIVCEATSTTVIEPAGRPRCWPAASCSCDAASRSPGPRPAVARRSPAPARGLQQPLHVHRRADGRDPGQHRLLGQHQGAARLLAAPSSTATGDLVANAPHLPVHLGSMGDTVKAVLAGVAAARSRPGDASCSTPLCRRHPPARLTVVTPVFVASAAAAASVLRRRSRATTPTSAASPPARCPRSAARSTRKACSSRTSCWSTAAGCASREVVALLSGGPHPVRDPAQNARRPPGPGGGQRPRRRASCRRMVDEFGPAVVRAYMRHVQDNADEAVRAR